jgi:hypothetical protein
MRRIFLNSRAAHTSWSKVRCSGIHRLAWNPPVTRPVTDPHCLPDESNPHISALFHANVANASANTAAFRFSLSLHPSIVGVQNYEGWVAWNNALRHISELVSAGSVRGKTDTRSLDTVLLRNPKTQQRCLAFTFKIQRGREMAGSVHCLVQTTRKKTLY